MTGEEEQTGVAEWGKAFEWKIKGASVEEVWAVTGDFLGVDRWVPKLIQSCELVEGEPQTVGCVRKVVLSPTAPGEHLTFFLEKLMFMDPLAHCLSYTMLEGSTVPGFSLMDHYVSTFSLRPTADEAGHTLLRWDYVCRSGSALSEEQTAHIVFSLYQAAVEALKERLRLSQDSITLLSKASPTS